MKRPFATRFAVHPAADTLVLDLAFASPPPAAVADALVSDVGRFVALANAGALCGPAIAPERSGIDAVAREATPSGQRWIFTGARIDPRSLTPLVNLVHRLHVERWPVQRLGVDASIVAELAEPVRLRFPTVRGALPFPVSIDADLDGAFDIVIDFDGPQRGAAVDRAIEVLGAWIGGVAAGAYASESMPPPLNRIEFSEEPVVRCPDALVLSVERFATGEEQAFAGLVNVVAKLDALLLRVRSLEVSE